MSEETAINVDGQDAQATPPEGDVDYEALYHKEKKYSQSLRSRAQDAEGQSEKLSLKAEEERQAKLIAEGKKDDLIAELMEKNKAMDERLSVFDKQDAEKREAIMEKIPEEDKVHFENMTLQQLEHFSKQGQSPEVSNPAEAVQGRTRSSYDMDSFLGESDDFKRKNYVDIVRSYEKKATNKVKVN